ncbi:MAG: hypothetical protein MRY83_16680 [Flavobacteriales bacterium]|nr:hypothetical protein [Flavobacteriales bacterium]
MKNPILILSSLVLMSLGLSANPPEGSGTGTGTGTGAGEGGSGIYFSEKAKEIHSFLSKSADANGDAMIDKYEMADVLSNYLDGQRDVQLKEALGIMNTFNNSDADAMVINDNAEKIASEIERIIKSEAAYF